jgi:hypothetical protein
MNPKSIVLFFFLTILLVISGCSSYTVTPITSNHEVENTQGLYYALPRNVVTIDIRVTKTNWISGPFSIYAAKYLGINDAILSSYTTYELSDIIINTYAEPDPQQYYFVDISKLGTRGKQNIMLGLSESGLIQDLNDNSDQTVLKEKMEMLNRNTIDYSQTFKYFAGVNLIEKIDTVVEKVTTDTSTELRTSFKRSLVEKSMEQRAKEAAEYLDKIKTQRLDILTGAQEVAYSGDAVRYMSEQLTSMEQEYLRMFTGIVQTETLQYRYYYLPESEVFSASVPLFYFSKTAGIVQDKQPQTEMVYIFIERAGNTTGLEKFSEKKGFQENKSNGFYYRIPEYAKFTIKEGPKLKAEASFLISQFGVVVNLPAKNHKIQFYPNTGAIRKIETK